MNMFRRAAALPADAGSLLEGLAETAWVLKMAQLGIGFNPDLLALAEKLNECAGQQLPAPRASRPIAGAHGGR